MRRYLGVYSTTRDPGKILTGSRSRPISTIYIHIFFSYNNLNKKFYIIAHLTTLILFVIIIFLLYIMPIFDYKTVIVTGSAFDNIYFVYSINPIFPFFPMLIFIISSINYLIIAILAKYKTGDF